MASNFSDEAKDAMLDALTPNLIGLHDGDPGVAGTANEVTGDGYSRQAATFGASSAGVRTLSADVPFVGPNSQPVSWFSVWEEDGVSTGVHLFLGRGELTGDTAFNSIGEFTLADTSTLSILADA